MPIKSKDEKELKVESTNKKTNTKTRKTPTSKKSETKSTKLENKKSTNLLSETPKIESKKSSTKKASTKVEKSNEKVTKKNIEDGKKSAKKSLSKKSDKVKKISTTTSSRARKSVKNVEVLEYYDLPYRYNKTVIKLLAQTPTSLFVYWEISDDDRENFLSKYGENFFSETKPVLLIRNETLNYTFEVEINDFANCWYLHVNDAKCVYNIELGRKYVNTYEHPYNDYIFVTISNKLESPNDHILFNNINNTVYFKNVKTNIKMEKKITDILSVQNISKIYNIYDLYKKIYAEESIEDFDFRNPSSSLSSSSFKI